MLSRAYAHAFFFQSLATYMRREYRLIEISFMLKIVNEKHNFCNNFINIFLLGKLHEEESTRRI